jgi:chromosome segregation protein
MRLTTIKLSGFKSFVDPTVLHLPTNITGVVGPNGCGKSNIIDAVRWVMGESSASRLRGDALTDVIFSGSSARKPVAQATVELIFDNSDHVITGEYAAFDEISVKRSVSRDGQSHYYLNGAKCRRRDITDLFLGTGLGPRSYSIVEQGMISDVIEAKPEELRVHLEEAAGISKYKERRRETETRIRHTRENLERLTDLRDEVGKQLEHLRRQARQAEQYQALQGERQGLATEFRALQFRAVDARLAGLREQHAKAETRLQQVIAAQRDTERRIEQGRVARDAAAGALATAQAASYDVAARLARIEQDIAHQRDLALRLKKNREDAEQALGEIARHIGEDACSLAALQQALAADAPRLEALREADTAASLRQREAEDALADWQRRADAQAAAEAEALRGADLARARIEHLERAARDADRRLAQLQGERATLDLEALGARLLALEHEHDHTRDGLEALNTTLDARKQALAGLQERQGEAQREQADVRKQLQAARGRLASLEALQHAALGQEQGAGREWLRRHGLDQAARVGERLQVEPGWETAVETALGQMLEAVLVEAPDDLLEGLAELGEGRLGLVAAADGALDCADTSLAARVRGPLALRRMLVRLHGADDLAAARRLLPTLADGDAIITRHGERLGQGWWRVVRANSAKQGALLREREIQALRAEIDGLHQRETLLDQTLAALKSETLVVEQAREDAQRSVYLAHRGVSELAGQVQGLRGRRDSAQARIERIDSELAELANATAQGGEGVRGSRAELEATLARMGELETGRAALAGERQQLAAALEAARQAARDGRDAVHGLALALESQRSQAAALEQGLARLGVQREQIDARLGELAGQLDAGDAPVRALDAERQAVLAARVDAEKVLTTARAALEGVDADLRALEQARHQHDADALAARERIAEQRLGMQAEEIEAERLRAAVAEAGADLAQLLDTLPVEADLAAREQGLADIESRLHRLEPVNLAAIQEHAEAEQRKQYLDAQDADLCAALDTLEEAIRKIDRETRSRFKDTFDRVNSSFQELYPRLFGGGHAYLELTGEDLLDTGVAIMARPPGKRVSNISLLSGGEKAMTAVALVFAIFRLNPAPFCLLDEVDAPLDEANVGRFTSMVAEMSQQVQFVYVTHNKATMESAQQLCGVTMREPGVSRVVSVDLAEAARLAGAA